MAPEQTDTKEAKVEVNPLELSNFEGESNVQGSKDVNLGMIMDIPVDVHIELGSTHLSIKNILKLGVGSILELDRSAGSSADIVVNGKLVGQGEVVVVNDNFGIRISKLVDPEQRIESL